MTRLLVLFEYATLNGGERSWLATLDTIRAARFDVTAAAPPDGPLAEELARRDVPIIPLDYNDRDGRRRSLAEIRESLADIIAQHGTELLHANSLNTSRLSGPVVRQSNVPSLGYLRDIMKLRAAAVADLNCHRRLLAVSHATRDFHIAQGLTADRVEVCYNGVDLDAFQPREPSGYLHDQLNISRDAPLVGTIGQIGLRKGFDVLVQAAAELVEGWNGDVQKGDAPAPHFLIIGERHSQKDESVRFEEHLRQAANERPLAGHLHFLNWQDDIPDLLPELTVLAHPARQEPLGRVLLEAAAAGVPVVATKVGGTSEIFPADSGALLVPPDDVPALRAALLEVLADSVFRQRLRDEGRRRMQDAFGRKQAAEGLLSYYRSILA